jgi:hypothetical protein
VDYRLERTLLIPRPRAEVFPFFADAGNLERITPDFLRFHIVTPGPIAMRAGTLIDYELRLYGLRFRWQTKIEEFTPVESFVDIQTRGPYRKWRHRHTFEEAAGGTLMRDAVEYAMPFGVLGRVARALVVERSLERIFDERNRAILNILGHGRPSQGMPSQGRPS